eukprot:6214295-Pleurochrysis_carterae.AAC.1
MKGDLVTTNLYTPAGLLTVVHDSDNGVINAHAIGVEIRKRTTWERKWDSAPVAAPTAFAGQVGLHGPRALYLRSASRAADGPRDGSTSALIRR